MNKLHSLSFLAALIAISSNAQSEFLDDTFDQDGIVITSIDEFTDNAANALAIQPDGKIIVVGSIGDLFTAFGIARYNEDGSLDSSFGVGGKVTVEFWGETAIATDVCIQPNGKILVSGYSLASKFETGVFSLCRLNNNGTLDADFDSDGKQQTQIGPDMGVAICTGMQLLPDYSIILCGGAAESDLDNLEFTMCKYHNDGTLDEGFGIDGIVRTPIGDYSALSNAIAIRPDDRILLAGTFANGANQNIALAQYNENGLLDFSFGTEGIALETIENSSISAEDVLIQPDEKIVTVGSVWTDSSNQILAMRFTANGEIDLSFGTDGSANILPDDENSAWGKSVTIQPDGKISLCGFSYSDAQPIYSVVIARLDTNGLLDSSLSSDGVITTTVGEMSMGNCVTLQANGKLVVAGETKEMFENNSAFIVLRYLANTESGYSEAGAQEMEFSAFPNPVVNTFTLNYYITESGPISMCIQDNAGRTVLSTDSNQYHNPGKHVKVIQLPSQLPAGFYNINIIGPKLNKSISFVH